MRFKLKNGGSLEVSGIKSVVINVQRGHGHLRQCPTGLWKRHESGRWLNYEMHDQTRVLGGMNDRELCEYVKMATSMPFVHVWVHGDTINVVSDVKKFEDSVGSSVTRLLKAFRGGIFPS